MWKWLLVSVVLLGSLVFSALMLQNMGLVDFGPLILARLEQVPAFQKHAAVYRFGLEAQRAMERERREMILLQTELAATREVLEAERTALELKQEEIEQEKAELQQERRQLDARAETLDSQAVGFQDFERLQLLYGEMRPDDLIPILAELDDPVVARILSGLDERQASGVLASMDPLRAAELSKRMGGISSK